MNERSSTGEDHKRDIDTRQDCLNLHRVLSDSVGVVGVVGQNHATAHPVNRCAAARADRDAQPPAHEYSRLLLSNYIICMTNLQPDGGIDDALLSHPLHFDSYRLDNGLDVILHEDHKASIVHVMVWYHVGSKDEPRERMGFAHLFEHMMFQGSENVGKTEHFTHVQGVGGVLNATTGQDRTNYFQTVPREHLSLALWLESDRMCALNVTEENYRNQLAVVKEEKGQRYDNAPYGLWYLKLLSMLFGDSEYGWGPIGDMDQLEAAPLQSVQAFHSRYYRPNNATLVVAGDFDAAEARRMISEHFAAIPMGEMVMRPEISIRPIGAQVRETITAAVPLPKVYVAFQGATVNEADATALSMLSLILSRGRSSRLHRSLVYDSQIARNAVAYSSDNEKSGMFLLIATGATQATDAGELERALWEEVRKVQEHGIEPRELEGAHNYLRTSFVKSLGRIESVADALAFNHVLRGDASRINRMLSEYQAVTADEIQRVACKYLRPEAAAVLLYVPQMNTDGA